MKLSEMNGEELSVCLCKIAEPLERIGFDKKTTAVFQEIADMSKDNMNNIQKASVMIGKYVPLLLGAHREDTFAILAAINDKTVEEIRSQNGMQTIKELKNALADPDLMDFFRRPCIRSKSCNGGDLQARSTADDHDAFRPFGR